MTFAIELLRVFSVLSFVISGVSCLRSRHMRCEFERYKLSRFRVFTGSLQLTGAAGLIMGLVFPPLTLLAAGGLSLLMLLGVAARVRVNDSLFQITPAALLSISNLVLLSLAVARV